MKLKEPSDARSIFDDGENSNGAAKEGSEAPYQPAGIHSPYNQGGTRPVNLDTTTTTNQFYGERNFLEMEPVNITNPVIPQGNDKSKIIKIIIGSVAGLMLIVVLLWVLTEQPWRKGGIKNLEDADQVIQTFISSLLSGDADQVADFFDKYTPSEISKNLKKSSYYSQLVTMEEQLKDLLDTGVKLDLTYTTFYKTRLTDTQRDLLQGDIKYVANRNLDIKDAYYVDVPFKMTASYMGVSQSQDFDYRFTFIRVGKRWYLYTVDTNN